MRLTLCYFYHFFKMCFAYFREFGFKDNMVVEEHIKIVSCVEELQSFSQFRTFFDSKEHLMILNYTCTVRGRLS